jgi:putative N6-adenine-specific DNA methylase
MKLQLVATCLFGLEKFLGEEIDALGCKRIETIDGRVTFEGTEADIARANINLRLAEHIFIKLGEFNAYSFNDLFEGTKALPWENFISKSDAFPVKGHAIKSKLYSVPDCQSIVKKAIVARLSEKYGSTWFTEDSGVKYQVEFFILKDKASLMIDTSGVALHKRGYRPASVAAPLRETLAAALALTSRPRKDVLIWDPFCGSGTIAIESAMILANIAPGVKREFISEKFPLIPAKIWNDERALAISKQSKDIDFEIFASDIDEDATDIAYENALRAGVTDYLNIFTADARKIQKPDRRGTIICNPPYGERLMTPREAEQLYRDIGKNFAHFEPWQIYILTSMESFERHYGRRADRVKRLYNGMLPCNLYQYYKPKDKK